MSVSRLLVLTAVILTGVARPLESQTVSAEQASAFRSMAAPANLPLGALAGSELVGRAAAIEPILEGTQGEGVGTVAIGWKRGSGQYRVKFSSPINKSTKEAVPFDFTEGAPSGSTFELTVANLMWQQPSDADVAELVKLCRAELNRPSCDIGDLPAVARGEARRLLRFDDIPMYIGASVAVTQRDFDYLDTALVKHSESHPNLAATFRVGRFSEALGFGFLSWSYQEQYGPGGDEQQICQPLEGTMATACNPAVLGAPKKRNSSIAGGEVRRFVTPINRCVPIDQVRLQIGRDVDRHSNLLPDRQRRRAHRWRPGQLALRPGLGVACCFCWREDRDHPLIRCGRLKGVGRQITPTNTGEPPPISDYT